LNFKGIDVDLLVYSAIITAKEMGLFLDGGETHKRMDSSESVLRFPQTTSSSYPIYLPKGDVSAQLDAITWFERFIANPKLIELLSQPCTVFHRFQYKLKSLVTGIEVKIRQVWGCPFRVLLLESYFFRNMVDYSVKFSASQPLSATVYGKSRVQLSDTVIQHVLRSKLSVISVDVESFDQTVPTYFWSLFFSVIYFSIDKLNTKEKLAFRYLMSYYAYTPYCYGTTQLRFQKRGVPSGMLITSLFDSFVTRTIINYCFLTEGYSNGAGNSAFSLGDDNIILGMPGITKKKVIQIYKKFGLKINSNKSEETLPRTRFPVSWLYMESEC